MALDQESRRMICSDLSSLCRYETEEAISGRQAERDLYLSGCSIKSAYRAKEYAEQRLLMLPGLVKGQSWYSDYEAIQDCIKQLDEYIRAQEAGQ